MHLNWEKWSWILLLPTPSPSLQSLEKWLKIRKKKKNEGKDNTVAMPSAYLSSSPPDNLKKNINIKSSFTMFEESKVGEPDILQFESRIPTGISHAMGYADR